MSTNNEFLTTNYNTSFSKYYFLKVAKEIIKIGNLENQNTILDYGCGEQIFSKLLTKPKFDKVTKNVIIKVIIKDKIETNTILFKKNLFFIN